VGKTPQKRRHLVGKTPHVAIFRNELVQGQTELTVVAYAEFENVIEVDRDRNVVFDFGV